MKVLKIRGFSLLEAMLAIAVILAASIGVVELYLSAKGNSDLQKTEEIAQQVASAAQQYLSSSYDVEDTVSTQALIDSGLLPSNIVVGDEIKGPFGGFDVASAASDDTTDHQQFSVTASNIPKKQAIAFCQHMFTTFAVFIGDSTTGNAITSLADCNAVTSANQAMTIAYPRTAYTADDTTGG